VVVDTSGSKPKRLHRGTDPSWSPDGKRIVFKTSVNGVLHITTISADGGVAVVLTPGVHPAWSPDGRRLSYMVEGARRSDIWIMDADGSARRCVTCAVREAR
jgi:TolB protein